MARGRSSSRGQRNASDPLLGAGLLADPQPLPNGVDPNDDPLLSAEATLQEIEDRRQFNPEGGHAPPRSFSGIPSSTRFVEHARRVVERTREFMEFPERMEAIPHKAVHRISSRLGFDVPAQVIHCVRRKVRREVMFSLDRRRRRKGSGAKRRRNEWSDVNC